MWILFWTVGLIFDFLAVAFHLIIVSHLIEFEVDHVNPLDLAYSLERWITPILACEGAAGLLCLTHFLFGFPVALIHVIIIGYLLYIKKQKGRIFDPMTIVRDLSSTKLRHILCAAFSAMSMAWILIVVILGLFL